MARMLPGDAELVSAREGKKRFERSNGRDTALYKNYPNLFLCVQGNFKCTFFGVTFSVCYHRSLFYFSVCYHLSLFYLQMCCSHRNERSLELVEQVF